MTSEMDEDFDVVVERRLMWNLHKQKLVDRLQLIFDCLRPAAITSVVLRARAVREVMWRASCVAPITMREVMDVIAEM